MMTENTPQRFSVRNMTRDELDVAVSWAGKEGWNPGQCDGDCFYETDPNGYFMGDLDGRMVASISAVAYDDSFGFIGFYIVRPEHRGKGMGISVWNRAIEYLGDRNIGLDGVLEQEPNYQKSGFKTAYHNIRYEGIGGGIPSDKAVPLNTIPFEQVAEFDQQFFPVNRKAFVKSWINMPNAVGRGIIKEGRLAGYGVIRSCRSGFKIGPLFADSGETAQDLFSALSACVPNAPLFFDVPDINPKAVAIALGRRMNKSFETVRMYTKGKPNVKMDGVFGVTSFELG